MTVTVVRNKTYAYRTRRVKRRQLFSKRFHFQLPKCTFFRPPKTRYCAPVGATRYLHGQRRDGPPTGGIFFPYVTRKTDTRIVYDTTKTRGQPFVVSRVTTGMSVAHPSDAVGCLHGPTRAHFPAFFYSFFVIYLPTAPDRCGRVRGSRVAPANPVCLRGSALFKCVH